MKLRYSKIENDLNAICKITGYEAILDLASGDTLVVGRIEKGHWEMPRRTRWEVYAKDQSEVSTVTGNKVNTDVTYFETLAEAKQELDWHLASILAKALGLSDSAWGTK